MKKVLLGLLLMVGVTISAFAQSSGSRGTVTGTVLDEGDKSPVIQATVQLLSVKDSSMVVGNVTNLDGHFSLSVRPGKYLLKVSYIGYTPFFKQVALTRNNPRLNVGKVELASDAIMLAEAVVVAEAPEVTAVADTLVYNSSAYRVPEGSALEELVKKLPGAEVDENGKITINGKEIKKIMIDGKEFFADDPNIAMKNLPVNIIDKVRAYDKQSDLARVTGIDDGEEETVLDLSVKPGMNKGWFGNADVAAGTEDRYSGKLMLNRFVGENQFTVIGSMNNVNDNGYPGGGGGFRWGGQNGLTSIKMGGFNFSTQSEKLETGGSVNYNYKDADIISKQASETFVSSATSSFKNAWNANRNKTTSLTADFRIEWKPVYQVVVLRTVEENQVVDGHHAAASGAPDVQWQLVAQAVEDVHSVAAYVRSHAPYAPQRPQLPPHPRQREVDMEPVERRNLVEERRAPRVGRVEMIFVVRFKLRENAQREPAVVAQSGAVLCRPFGVKSYFHPHQFCSFPSVSC